MSSVAVPCPHPAYYAALSAALEPYMARALIPLTTAYALNFNWARARPDVPINRETVRVFVDGRDVSCMPLADVYHPFDVAVDMAGRRVLFVDQLGSVQAWNWEWRAPPPSPAPSASAAADGSTKPADTKSVVFSATVLESKTATAPASPSSSSSTPYSLVLRGGSRYSPIRLGGLAFDSLENTALVTEMDADCLSAVTATGPVVLAGPEPQREGLSRVSPVDSGLVDGAGSAVRFDSPGSVAVCKLTGDVFICDMGNGALRRCVRTTDESGGVALTVSTIDVATAELVGEPPARSALAPETKAVKKKGDDDDDDGGGSDEDGGDDDDDWPFPRPTVSAPNYLGGDFPDEKKALRTPRAIAVNPARAGTVYIACGRGEQFHVREVDLTRGGGGAGGRGTSRVLPLGGRRAPDLLRMGSYCGGMAVDPPGSTLLAGARGRVRRAVV
jgi:hypothetical protein